MQMILVQLHAGLNPLPLDEYVEKVEVVCTRRYTCMPKLPTLYTV